VILRVRVVRALDLASRKGCPTTVLCRYTATTDRLSPISTWSSAIRIQWPCKGFVLLARADSQVTRCLFPANIERKIVREVTYYWGADIKSARKSFRRYRHASSIVSIAGHYLAQDSFFVLIGMLLRQHNIIVSPAGSYLAQDRCICCSDVASALQVN